MKTTYRSKTADAVLASLNDHSDLVAQRDDLLAACEAALAGLQSLRDDCAATALEEQIEDAIARAKGE